MFPKCFHKNEIKFRDDFKKSKLLLINLLRQKVLNANVTGGNKMANQETWLRVKTGSLLHFVAISRLAVFATSWL